MSTRSRVLSALKSAEHGVSGEALARELGVSRTAIAKHVAALRELGYAIEGHVGTGYRLVSGPALCLPEEVAPLLTHPLLGRVEGGAATGSTNDDARALARSGAPEGTVVVAARQSRGRGRFDRSWDSPSGGAYLSIVLRPARGPAEIGSLPLAIAVGVARGLERLGAHPQLKWPNDVLLAGRKVAGILLEMSGQADRVDWVVVGIGVNVGEAPEVGRAGVDAAALSEQAPTITPAETAAAVLDEVAATYERWLAEGFGALSEEFVERHALGGSEVDVRSPEGAVVASGVVAGIDAEGRLLVRTEESVRSFTSGEVSLRNARS